MSQKSVILKQIDLFQNPTDHHPKVKSILMRI